MHILGLGETRLEGGSPLPIRFGLAWGLTRLLVRGGGTAGGGGDVAVAAAADRGRSS